MNRFLVVLAFSVLCIASAFAQSMSSANEVAPLPVVTSPMISWPTMATATFSVGGTATNIGPYLPTGTKGFFIAPIGGDVNYGGSGVAQGAGWPKVASGATQIIYTAAPRPTTLYLISYTAGATYTVRITPFK